MGIFLVLILLLSVCRLTCQLPLRSTRGSNLTEEKTLSRWTEATSGVHMEGRHILQSEMDDGCSRQCGSITVNWPLSIEDSCGLPAYRLLCDKVFGNLYFNAGGFASLVLSVGPNFILVGEHQGPSGGFCDRQNATDDSGVRSEQFVIDRHDDPPSAFYLSADNVVLINNSVAPGQVNDLAAFEGFAKADNFSVSCTNFTQLPQDSYPGCTSCCIIPVPNTKLKGITFGSRGHCHSFGSRLMVDPGKGDSFPGRPTIRVDFDDPDGVPSSSSTPAQKVQYSCTYCSPKWPKIPTPFNLDNGIAPCGDRGFYLLCDRLKGDLFIAIGQNLFNVAQFGLRSLYFDAWRLLMQGGCGASRAIFLSLGKAQKLYWSHHNVALSVGCKSKVRLETDIQETKRCNAPCDPRQLDVGLLTMPVDQCPGTYCCNTSFPSEKKTLDGNAGQFTFAMEGGICGQSLVIVGDPSSFNMEQRQVWLKLVYGHGEDSGARVKTNASLVAGTVVGSVVGALLLVACTWIFLWWRVHRQKQYCSSPNISDPEDSKQRQLANQRLARWLGPFSRCLSSSSSPEGPVIENKLPPLNLPHANSPSCMNQWDTQVVPTASSSSGNSGEISRQVLSGKVAIGDLSLLRGGAGEVSQRVDELSGEGEPANISRAGSLSQINGILLLQGPHSVGAKSDSVGNGGGSEAASEDRLVRAGSDASDKLTAIDMRSLLPIQLSEIDLRMENMIGGGGYGRVYRWERLGTQYAVKVVRGEPQELRDLWQEVILLKELRHPNVVQFIFACEKPPNEIYIVMEYVQKGSLYKLLHETKQALSTRQKVHMAWDVAKGMAFLHEINVVHRDLKSANLLVSHDGTIKVCDFGQSRLLNGTHLTTDNRAGTLPYTAPEAFEDFQRCPKESDVYAYGIILWELFSGEIPWSKHAEVEIMKSIVMDKKRPPISPDWPPAIIDIISRCWAQDPRDRPTFAGLTTELKAVMDSLPVDPKTAARRRLRTPNGSLNSEAPLAAHKEVQQQAG